MNKTNELIRAGIAMFELACQDIRIYDIDGVRWYSGCTSEGSGCVLWHKMNRDKMTPSAVAIEVGHLRAVDEMKKIRKQAEVDCNKKAAAWYGIEL